MIETSVTTVPGAADEPTTPAIQAIRGKDYPDQGANPKLIVDFVERRWKDGESEAMVRYRQGTHNLLLVNGRQHITWNRKKQAWEDLPILDGEPRATMNEIRPILKARLDRMLPDSLGWVARPKSNAYEAKNRAEVGVMAVRSAWKRQGMDETAADALMLAYATGVTALKSFWNPTLGPLTAATMVGVEMDPMTGQPMEVEFFVNEAGQPVETEEEAFHYRPGDSDTALRTVFNIRLNPEAYGWTPSKGWKWLVDSDVVPIETAREKYPELASEIRAAQGSETLMTYERLAAGSSQLRPLGTFVTAAATTRAQSTNLAEMVVIREYWEDRSTFFPEGRLVVTVGGALAYDGPWPQGVFPYAPIFDEPGTLSAYGRPTVNDMISPQQVINDQWTAIVAEMRSSGTAQFAAWDVPGVPNQLTQVPNAIVKIPIRNALSNRPISDVFKRIDPAQVAPDKWRLIEQAKLSLYNVGAYHEVSRGQIPPGIDSGVAIEHLLQSESMQMRLAIKALRRSLITWAQHQLHIMKWGYGDNEMRWLPADRPDLKFMVESVSGKSLPNPDEFEIDLEYFRPQSEAAVRAEVKELLQLQVIDPRRALQIMDMGRGFEDIFESATRHYARASKENLDFERGEYLEAVTGVDPTGMPMVEFLHQDGSPFLLPLDDDHAIHIDVHLQVALDDTKPWAMRQKVLAHTQRHRETLAMLTTPPPAPDGADTDKEDGNGPE